MCCKQKQVYCLNQEQTKTLNLEPCLNKFKLLKIINKKIIKMHNLSHLNLKIKMENTKVKTNKKQRVSQ